MDRKPLIGVSICAVVLLVLGSLSNVVASNNNDTNKNYQLDDNTPFIRYFGLISKVNKTDNGYISFYTIFVIYWGADAFEHSMMPFIGFSKSETIVIRDIYKGILTRHFIFIEQDIPQINHMILE
jgi:hypothetical protein